MKFAHIADVHLGREQFNQPFRYEDYLKAFREAIERAVREEVDFILIPGDLFHVSRPSPRTIRDAIEVLELPRRKGIPVFAIEGNHDKTIRETSVFDLLEHLGLIYTVGLKREPRKNEFQASKKLSENRYLVWGLGGDVEIHGLRHHTRWQLIRGEINVLKALFRGREGILMLHQAIDYLSKDTPYQDAFDLRLNELPDGFSYYALGHIHVNRVATPEQTGLSGLLVYPGSLERTDVREASHIVRYPKKAKGPVVVENLVKKGFYVVEDFQPEFVKINARPFYRVIVEGNSKAELKEKLLDVGGLIPKDAIAVIYLEGSIKGGISLSEFNELLKDSGIKYYTIRSNLTSSALPGGRAVREEDVLTPWEKELFLHLRAEPKEFLGEMSDFVSWLLDKYSRGQPETHIGKEPKKENDTELKNEGKKETKPVSRNKERTEPGEATGKRKPSIKKKNLPSSGLDAWLRR